MNTHDEYMELISLLKQRKVILFVGAGVPASLGMPTWKDLIKKMGNDLGIDPDEYIGYGDYLQLASYYENNSGSKKAIQDYIKAKSKEVQPLIKDSIVYNKV